MITKMRGKYVIGFKDKDHVIYEDGEIVFEGNEIIYVGHHYKGEVDDTYEAGNAVISPGFIDLDALGDIDHALIDSEIPIDKKHHFSWSEDYFQEDRKEWMSVEEEAFKSLYAYSQLIMNGITTAMPITSVNYKKCGETYEEIVAAAHHAGQLGLRVYLGPGYVSGMQTIGKDGKMVVSWMPEEGKAGLKRAFDFVENYNGAYDGLINGVLVPERVELQTEEILRESKKIARQLNCPIRLHAAQGAFEYNEIMKRHGVSTITYLKNLDFLDENTLIPHAIFASGYHKLADQSDRDLDIIKEAGSSVIHCPLVFSRDGEAVESFGRYVRKGINMSMGTDTFPPDMIRNINIGSSLALLMDEGRKENYFSEFYRAATLGGAKALGREDLGRLAPGAKADIIVIDLDGYHMGTIDDPLRTLCLAGSGRDVKTSIINGKFVMKDRVIPGFDYETAKQKAQGYYEKMKMSYYHRSCAHLPEEEFFSSSFKIMKAKA